MEYFCDQNLHQTPWKMSKTTYVLELLFNKIAWLQSIAHYYTEHSTTHTIKCPERKGCSHISKIIKKSRWLRAVNFLELPSFLFSRFCPLFFRVLFFFFQCFISLFFKFSFLCFFFLRFFSEFFLTCFTEFPSTFFKVFFQFFQGFFLFLKVCFLFFFQSFLSVIFSEFSSSF